jgi:1-acylglycerone phosphate reductase
MFFPSNISTPIYNHQLVVLGHERSSVVWPIFGVSICSFTTSRANSRAISTEARCSTQSSARQRADRATKPSLTHASGGESFDIQSIQSTIKPFEFVWRDHSARQNALDFFFQPDKRNSGASSPTPHFPTTNMAATDDRQTVLITGCAPGGIGHSLALAFHARGLRVFATARKTGQLTSLAEKGIETLAMVVDDDESVVQCLDAVQTRTGGRLDYLGIWVAPTCPFCFSR